MSWGLVGASVALNGRTVLADVSLDVEPGEVAGVIGGDGAGKTTLLRTLAGIRRATGGEVRRPDARRAGYMAATSGTYPDLSVEENLEFVSRIYRVPHDVARDRVADLVERTGLAPFRNRLAGSLSGGMRQKLGVIRALVHQPDLLVLDEPTTGVDPVSRSDMWSLLLGVAAEGTAVVFSTTYLDEAARATHLLVLDAGRTLTSGTPDHIVMTMPGSITTVTTRPAGEAGPRAWRRRGAWRVWSPEPATGAITPDLHDAVVALTLAGDLDPTGRSER